MAGCFRKLHTLRSARLAAERLHDPFDDDQRNDRPRFPHGKPVHPDITLHWEAGNPLALLGGTTVYTNKIEIDAGEVDWPLDYAVIPRHSAISFAIAAEGQAAEGGKAVDIVHGRVVDVDLDVDANHDGKIDDADEPLEVDPGGYVCVGTNNLTPVTLKLEPVGLPGKLTLSATMGGDRIRIWKDAGRATEVILTNGCAQVAPGTLYVEGVTNSAALRDVELRLEYDENPEGQNNRLFKCEDRVKLTAVKVDLDIDSDNNGAIEEADEAQELTEPGKLIYLNHDDDNKNDIEDKAENTAIVTDEDDLQPIKLAFSPNIAGGKIILAAPSGGSRIQVWGNSTKGVASEKVDLPKTWTIGTDAVPATLYVEGIDPGAAQLKLAYEVNSVEVCKDEIKLGIVKIEFKERGDTKYGYDNGTVDNNPVPKSVDTPPQKYDWVNVDRDNKTTDVDVEITPASYAKYVNFISSDDAKTTCNPVAATANPQKLTITGTASGTSHVQTRLGTTTGAKGTRLNVACYKLAALNVNFYKVSATGLAPDGTTAEQFESGANAFLKRGVSELSLTDNGTTITNYDDNANSKLDIDATAGDGGSEWVKVTAALGAPVGMKLLHVKALRVNIGGTWVNATGLRYGDWTLVSDESTSKVRTVAHEMLHKLGLKDTGPSGSNTANIMYYMSNGTKYFVGYFKVEGVQTGSGTSYTPKQHELQWEMIYR
jgi:hypothetical protein